MLVLVAKAGVDGVVRSSGGTALHWTFPGSSGPPASSKCFLDLHGCYRPAGGCLTIFSRWVRDLFCGCETSFPGTIVPPMAV
eukprot:6470275-Amphidinium_carterae.2